MPIIILVDWEVTVTVENHISEKKFSKVYKNGIIIALLTSKIFLGFRLIKNFVNSFRASKLKKKKYHFITLIRKFFY